MNNVTKIYKLLSPNKDTMTLKAVPLRLASLSSLKPPFSKHMVPLKPLNGESQKKQLYKTMPFSYFFIINIITIIFFLGFVSNA